jgi:xanthine dehydrogenase/oxidase
MVAANTGTGVFKHDGPYSVYINLNKVTELQGVLATSPQLILGANTTITDTIAILQETGHPVWEGVAAHLLKIASYGIRNQGTLAGNLMLKQAHTDFPSDVFLALATVGAQLEIVGPTGTVEELDVANIGGHNMDRKLITRIKLPELTGISKDKPSAPKDKKDINALWLNANRSNADRSGQSAGAGPEWKFRSFKIMPRSTNAHAYVNAGFLALVDSADHFRIVGRPSIVFGGISSGFVHARTTEDFLQDRPMDDHDIFLEALAILAEEMVLQNDPVLASPLYRKQLAMGLFYKVQIYPSVSCIKSYLSLGSVADLGCFIPDP